MKKLVCLLLCLMMVFPAVFSQADAEIQISSVTVSLKIPAPGASAGSPAVTLPSGANYTYNSGKSGWSEWGTGVDLSSSDKFQAGKLYMAEIYLESASGYIFDDKATVTCTTAYRELSVECEGYECRVYVIVYVTEDGVKLISSGSINVTLPEAEMKASVKPSVTVPSGSHYKYISGKSGWINEKTMQQDEFPRNLMPSSATLKAGQKYTAFIWLQADKGYRFNADISISSPVKALYVYSVSDYSYCRVYVGFTMPKAKVSLNPVQISRINVLPKGRIKVLWKKLSSKSRKKIKRIQIQISTDKNFKKNVITKIVGSGNTSCTIKGLKANKKYYVRIRAYTKSGSMKLFSKWSVKKMIRAK